MYEEIIKKLKSQKNLKNIAGMARFGINSKNTLGVSIPLLRNTAKEIKKTSDNRHELAEKLWNSKIHEARILAGLVDEVDKVTEKQMDKWASQFDSWDICDQVCMNLFNKTPYAFDKAKIWSKKKEEFYKRSGFSLMAALAFHDKNASDSQFIQFFPVIKRGATDERNFVKKAVNWALRQIGKKRPSLKKEALKTAYEIQKLDSKAAKWIAKDAIRELKTKKF